MIRHSFRLFMILWSICLSFGFAPASQAQAQPCTFTFAAITPDYETKALSLSWMATAPLGYDNVAIQVRQDGITVEDPTAHTPFRLFALPTKPVLLDMSNLKPGKFALHALIVDANGNPCQNNDRQPYESAQGDLSWSPPEIDYTISSFDIDHEKRVITFKLEIANWEPNIIYQASVESKGVIIGATQKLVLDADSVTVDVPITSGDIRKLTDPMDVMVKVHLVRTREIQQADREHGLTIPLPDKLSFVTWLGKTVSAGLSDVRIVMGILLVMAGLVVYRVFAPDSKPTQADRVRVPRRPKNPDVPKASAVRVRITQAATPLHENVLTINDFPCLIGRNKYLEHGALSQTDNKKFVNVRNDHQVSRQQLEIRRHGEQYTLANVGGNIAVVNGKPTAPNHSVQLSSLHPTIVEIGEQTKLELQPH